MSGESSTAALEIVPAILSFAHLARQRSRTGESCYYRRQRIRTIARASEASDCRRARPPSAGACAHARTHRSEDALEDFPEAPRRRRSPWPLPSEESLTSGRLPNIRPRANTRATRWRTREEERSENNRARRKREPRSTVRRSRRAAHLTLQICQIDYIIAVQVIMYCRRVTECIFPSTALEPRAAAFSMVIAARALL